MPAKRNVIGSYRSMYAPQWARGTIMKVVIHLEATRLSDSRHFRLGGGRSNQLAYSAIAAVVVGRVEENHWLRLSDCERTQADRSTTFRPATGASEKCRVGNGTSHSAELYYLRPRQDSNLRTRFRNPKRRRKRRSRTVPNRTFPQVMAAMTEGDGSHRIRIVPEL